MKSLSRMTFAILITLCMFGASENMAAQVAVRFDPATPTVASGATFPTL